jgi:cell wall-associated NlpC family hydrolase
MIDFAGQADLVNRYLSARYQPLGRGPDVFDCWGLVLAVLRDLGCATPIDPMQYGSNPLEVRRLMAAHYQPSEWVRGDLEPGALVFFPLLERASHVGVWLADGLLDVGRQTGARFRQKERFCHERFEVARWAG